MNIHALFVGLALSLFAAGCAAPEDNEEKDSQESRSSLLPGHANEDTYCGEDPNVVYDEELGGCARRTPLPGHAGEDTYCGEDPNVVYDEELGGCARRTPLPGHAGEEDICRPGFLYDEETGRCISSRG